MRHSHGIRSAALILSIVAVAFAAVSCGDEDNENGSEPEEVITEAGCALTGAAVAEIVRGVTRGRPTTQLVGTTLAGVFVPISCSSMVKHVEANTNRVREL